MTCIVGVIDKSGNVWIGGDSAGVDSTSYFLEIRADEKVFTRTGKDGIVWAFGFTTSFRMGQLIRYQLKLPEVTSEDERDLHGFFVTKFIPALRKCLSDGGFREIQHGRESGGTFIVGLLGQLFIIRDDYQVARSVHNFVAVGVASLGALCALYVTEDEEPDSRIRRVLEATDNFSVGVRGPFTIVVTQKREFQNDEPVSDEPG